MTLAAPDFYDIVIGLFDELGELKYGVATGGSATTLVDSGLGGSNDDYNNWTALIVSAGSAAPEAEFAEVTDYVSADGTLTVTFGAAPAAADVYALASKKYPIDKVKQVINRALVRMGSIPKVDITLTAASGTTTYTIPAAARAELRRVYINQSTTSDNERPTEQTTWRQEGADLIFRRQPPAGIITLVYMGPHSKLTDHDDTLDASVPLNRIIAEAFYLATVDRVRRMEGPSAGIKRQLDDAKEERDWARRKYPIWDPGTPFKPVLSGRKGKRQRRRERYGPFYT